MTQITVERVTVKPKVFDSGDEAWGVFSDNKWVDVFGLDHKPEKGETLDLDIKTTTKNGRTFYNGRVKPTQQQVQRAKETLTPEPKVVTTQANIEPFTQLTNVLPVNNIRTTSYTHPLNDYERLINRGFELAGINGVTDDAARVSLVAILAIAYGEGKLSIDDLVSEGTELTEGWNEALEAGDKILNDNSWADREWFEGPKEKDPLKDPLDDYGPGVKKVEAEMEAAKARMDKFVTTSTKHEHEHDYKTELGAAIKTYCFNNKLDFKEHKFQTLFKCAKTMKLETLSQEQAKEAIEQLKVMP